MSEKKKRGEQIKIKIKIHIILFNNLLKLLLIDLYKRRKILNPDLIRKNTGLVFIY